MHVAGILSNQERKEEVYAVIFVSERSPLFLSCDRASAMYKEIAAQPMYVVFFFGFASIQIHCL